MMYAYRGIPNAFTRRSDFILICFSHAYWTILFYFIALSPRTRLSSIISHRYVFDARDTVDMHCSEKSKHNLKAEAIFRKVILIVMIIPKYNSSERYNFPGTFVVIFRENFIPIIIKQNYILPICLGKIVFQEIDLALELRFFGKSFHLKNFSLYLFLDQYMSTRFADTICRRILGENFHYFVCGGRAFYKEIRNSIDFENITYFAEESYKSRRAPTIQLLRYRHEYIVTRGCYMPN